MIRHRLRRLRAAAIAAVAAAALMSAAAPATAAAATTPTWLSVSMNGNSEDTCAIDSTHSLYCWGVGHYLPGADHAFYTPQRIAGPGNWAVISESTVFQCGIRLNGTLWCWGQNGQGQLGTGDTAVRAQPTQIGTATDWTDVRVNREACAVRSDHTRWCWGADTTGEQGSADTTPHLVPTEEPDTGWAYAGLGIGCAVHTDGGMWCWGRNYAMVPTLISDGWKVAPVQGFCAVKADSTLWCNLIGTPTQVYNAHWRTVAENSHQCAIRPEGSLWCWGANDAGEDGLGYARQNAIPSPRRVGTATNWATVAVSVDSSCATTTAGELYCWGDDSHGQLGNGTGFSDNTTPQLIPHP